MARAKRTDNKGRVLRVGESQNKQGRYIYKWTDCTGTRNTVYAITLVELREKEQKIQRDIQDGINSTSANMTLNQLFDLYMSTKSNIRETTRVLYLTYWSANIKPSILSDMKISQIKQLHVKKWIIELKDKGAKTSSIKAYKTLLTSVFQFAVDNDYIRRNPCRNCDQDKAEPSTKTALTKRQQEKLVDFLENDDLYKVYYPLILFILNTGLRAGDDDDKIRLNQRKPSKYKGLSRFGPEKNLQRINKFMKERPIFYKNLIQMKENIRFYLRCFYCITKVMILQFNSENRTELARNG